MNIKLLLEDGQTVPLYRGMDNGTYRDLTGQQVSNRPRTSKTASNTLMNLWDNFVIPTIPQLHGTAPRGNCLIASRDLNHASMFGNPYVLRVDNHSTPFTWCAMDFNELPGMGDVADILEMMSKSAGISMMGNFLPELDKKLQSSWNLRRLWKMHTHQKELSPTAWTIDFFEFALKHQAVGVSHNIDDVPADAAEVWFQGTATAVKRA